MFLSRSVRLFPSDGESGQNLKIVIVSGSPSDRNPDDGINCKR